MHFHISDTGSDIGSTNKIKSSGDIDKRYKLSTFQSDIISKRDNCSRGTKNAKHNKYNKKKCFRIFRN
jgi:hypothetical protein